VAEYKKYEYGDNAKLMKNVVQNKPSPVMEPTTPFGKHVSGIGKSVVSGIGNKLSQVQDAKNAIAGGVTDKFNQIGRYFGGTTSRDLKKEKKGLDVALDSNTFKPSTLSPGQPQAPSPSAGVPRQSGFAPNPDAQFDRLGAGPRPGAELGPDKTITQNRFGEVGLWDKAGKRLDPMQNRVSGGNLGGTPVPAGQETSFMKVGSNPNGPGVINYTELFNRDAKMAGLAMESAKAGQPPGGFFTGPGEPGSGNYSQDSMMSQFKGRRDMIQSRLDDFERKNVLGPNASLGDIVNQRIASKGMRDEIKQIDEQIFGRTELANKIMAALIGNKGALDVQSLQNQGGMEKQALDNAGTYGVREMMEQAETGRTAMQIGAGQYAAKTTTPSEKRKSGYNFTKDSGMEAFKHLLQTEGLEAALKFGKEYMPNFEEDEEAGIAEMITGKK